MNACTFCKNGKRKCDKVRPSCSNCLRLRKTCVYIEDSFQTIPVAKSSNSRPFFELHGSHLAQFLSSVYPLSQESLQESTVNVVMGILGSVENMRAVSAEFFVTTHQRVPIISKFRFYDNLQYLTARPSTDFAALCLSILLIQQMPLGKMVRVQSTLYLAAKNLLSLLEATNNISLDFLHCALLVTFYEMGHGLHTAAYISVSACARIARVLGLHRKAWLNIGSGSNKLILEEEKRAWWAILNMERFIGLRNGDAVFITHDPQISESIPVADLLWAESHFPADLEGPITAAPALNTPASITVGQMARECQVSHIAGRVVRHLFDPTPDPDFHAQESFQLERTLKSYLPLLANEELKIGKYCAAFGICNSALLTLYEFKLNNSPDNSIERHRILQSMAETSLSAYTFAYASYGDHVNYPEEIKSPYLPYSLFQAAIVQYRLWKQNGDLNCKQRFETLKQMLDGFTYRWMVAREYFEFLENINHDWPPIALPPQGLFIGIGTSKA